MRLISNNSLPDWCDHNPDIRDGYRPPKPSFRYCLRSILALHNETGNIYTHLIGFIFYSILWWHTIQCNSFKKFASSDRFVFGTFFVGILTCFLLSTMFHTFQCHSRRVYKLFAKLDYIGITTMISTSTVCWVYYGFYYSRVPIIVYTSITAFMAIVCTVLSLLDRFSSREFQSIRAVVFIIYGLTGLAPFVHFCRYYKLGDQLSAQIVFKGLILLAVMAVLYITGAVIYAMKVPERIYQNQFDYWFNSHQLFHLLTISGGLVFFQSLSLVAQSRLNFEDYRSHNSTDV